jgi:hypothetical protein
LPATDAEQERVDVPDPPVMLAEDSVHARLVEFVVTPRVTVPENPFIGETVIEEVPETPVIVVTLVGLAAILKSAAGAT